MGQREQKPQSPDHYNQSNLECNYFAKNVHLNVGVHWSIRGQYAA